MGYEAILETQRDIEGMLMEVSAVAWCALLEAQHAAWEWTGGAPNHYLEIGAFKGKSASILAGFSGRYGNDLTIVDPVVRQDTRERLDAIASGILYLEQPSERLRFGQFHRDRLCSMGFIHIDGMHTYSAVMSDLIVSEELLAEFGIICIDDFHSDIYPQVSAATYKYLTGQTDLSLFLVGFNKGYLCRNIAKRYFAQFSEKHLLHHLESAGHPVSMVKNDRHDSCDTCAMVPFQGERFVGPGFAVESAKG